MDFLIYLAYFFINLNQYKYSVSLYNIFLLTGVNMALFTGWLSFGAVIIKKKKLIGSSSFSSPTCHHAFEDIGTSLSSMQDLSHRLFHPLLIREPEVSATYFRSLHELAQTLTSLIGINKVTILQRIRQIMELTGKIGHSAGYMESLGFKELIADSLFNRRRGKDVFVCLFLVIMYSFIMEIPRLTGA